MGEARPLGTRPSVAYWRTCHPSRASGSVWLIAVGPTLPLSALSLNNGYGARDGPAGRRFWAFRADFPAPASLGPVTWADEGQLQRSLLIAPISRTLAQLHVSLVGFCAETIDAAQDGWSQRCRAPASDELPRASAGPARTSVIDASQGWPTSISNMQLISVP